MSSSSGLISNVDAQSFLSIFNRITGQINNCDFRRFVNNNQPLTRLDFRPPWLIIAPGSGLLRLDGELAPTPQDVCKNIHLRIIK